MYRGALIPRELAVSALTFERLVEATTDGSDIEAEITEQFISNSLGDLLNPVFSYFTLIVDDPQDDTLNDLNDPRGSTITP